MAVLPGTGGLTRLVDKRNVRHDRADFFCTIEEGIRGRRAVDWRLVDEVAAKSRFDEAVAESAAELVSLSDRPAAAEGIQLSPLAREISETSLAYATLSVALDRETRVAEFRLHGPETLPPADPAGALAQGVRYWPLAVARAFDDAILHLRLNEPTLGTWVLRTEGDGALVAAHDELLAGHPEHWFIREVTLYLKRVLKRLDMSARSIFALIEPGSCFTGTLLELALAADRSYMLEGGFEGDNRPPAWIQPTVMNFGAYPGVNGLTRMATRYLGDRDGLAAIEAARGRQIEAAEADALGLVTFAPDDIDWDDEVRIAIEERATRQK